MVAKLSKNRLGRVLKVQHGVGSLQLVRSQPYSVDDLSFRDVSLSHAVHGSQDAPEWFRVHVQIIKGVLGLLEEPVVLRYVLFDLKICDRCCGHHAFHIDISYALVDGAWVGVTEVRWSAPRLRSLRRELLDVLRLQQNQTLANITIVIEREYETVKGVFETP